MCMVLLGFVFHIFGHLLLNVISMYLCGGWFNRNSNIKLPNYKTVSWPSDHYNGNFFSGENGVFILNQLQTFKVPSLTLGQFCDVPNSNANTWLAQSIPFLFLQKLTEVNASIISSNYNLCSIFTIDRLYTPSCYTEQCFLYFRAWIVHLVISRKWTNILQSIFLVGNLKIVILLIIMYQHQQKWSNIVYLTLWWSNKRWCATVSQMAHIRYEINKYTNQK